MLAFARFETIRTFRNSKFLLFLIVMPVGLYLMFTQVDTGTTSKADGYQQTMIAMAVYAATASAMYATGPELAQERATGWIRQILVTPLSFTSWMIAKVVQSLLLTVPGTVAVAVVAALVSHVRMPAAHWLAFLVVMMVGSIPFALLGQIVGQLFRNQSASAGQLLVLFGLSFLGGVFLPLNSLPEQVQEIGRLTPSYHLVQLATEVVRGESIPWTQPVGLLAAAGVIGAVVLVLWRRDGATG